MDRSTFYLIVVRIAFLAGLGIAICEAGAAPVEPQLYQTPFSVINLSASSGQSVIKAPAVPDVNICTDVVSSSDSQVQTANVPEPATIFIFGLGSVILLRKKRK